MSPLMLRQLWSVVEETQSYVLLSLDDSSLVQWLLNQLRLECSLDRNQTNVLCTYIYSRLPLIRDMAQGR